MLRAPAVTAAAFAATFAVAACGGSSSANNGNNSNNSNNSGNSASIRPGSAAFHADELRVSQCIRAHGVPNYPDPPSGGGMHSVSNGNTVTVNGVKLDASPQTLRNAQQACAKYAPVGPAVSSSQLANIRQGAVRAGVCMRANGVPDFPDTSITTGPGGHGLRIGSGAGANLNPSSPAFKAAQAKCTKFVQKVAREIRHAAGMPERSVPK
jgi:hypothetical protein